MFKEIFAKVLWEKRDNLSGLENSKGIRAEIIRIKKLMLRQSDELALVSAKNIKFLEKKLKALF